MAVCQTTLRTLSLFVLFWVQPCLFLQNNNTRHVKLRLFVRRAKETNPSHCVLGISPEEKIKVTFMPPMPLNPILEAPIHSLPSPLVQLEEGRGGFCKCAGLLKGYLCFSCADHQHIFSHYIVLSLNSGLRRWQKAYILSSIQYLYFALG